MVSSIMNSRDKVEIQEIPQHINIPQNINIEIIDDVITQSSTSNPTSCKKRGRKPKGGKIVVKNIEETNKPAPLPNIILHLKCSLQDLKEHNTKLNEMVTDPLSYNASVPPEIMTYNDNLTSFSNYENSNDNKIQSISSQSLPLHSIPLHSISSQSLAYKPNDVTTVQLCKSCNCNLSSENDGNSNANANANRGEESDISMKDINSKLKALRIQFYKNTLNDKKSACFWCTYEYDSPPCYIPKYENNSSICGYGSFCRPECAVGYLMKEQLDDSTKFERYHLLNRIYSKVYGYKKNIKPAPNPYYLLDKFYGNLSIQEYRKLLNSAHMLLTIDKPMTRILPELHEDNEEFILNIYGGSSAQSAQSGGMYKVKRQSEKQQGPTKSSIIRNNFGLTN